MEIETKPTDMGITGGAEATAVGMPMAVIGPEQLGKFTKILMEYRTGKVHTESRIVSSENWWKLRNTVEEEKDGEKKNTGFKSVSAWLHNVIANKHADAMEACPEPNILPREEGDKAEAQMLSAIIPCILAQNHFERTYSDVCWQKLKTGTGVYKVVWDRSKLNGLGDISVERVNLLNIYWEPGVTDIQKSRYFFHTEVYDKDVLEEMYPELKGKMNGQGFINTKFQYDDNVSTENKHTVIDVYYKKYVGTRLTVQYVKYVGDQVLFATENDLKMAMSGLYDHGRYPYIFDALFPIEGSPCGYGFVDICRNPQTEIDKLKSCFVTNAMVGARQRYLKSSACKINTDEFLDLDNAIINVEGTLDERHVMPVQHQSLDGNYIGLLDKDIDELRETSGNTETATGNTGSGVTAASAIAALQEASGKLSRDLTAGIYRAYEEIVDMCIELIRQFYDMPRQFRIVGEYGMHRYVSYSNKGIQAQHQGNDFGQDMGFRLPVFDIKVSAQKRNVYTKVAQNELAIQLLKLGFFSPQMTDQALMCLDVMDFDGKDQLMQKIAQNGTLYQKLIQYMQMALAYAVKFDPQMAMAIQQDLAMVMGGGGGMASGGGGGMVVSDHIAGVGKDEAAIAKGEASIVKNARARSAEASQPDGGRVLMGGKK